MIAWSYTVKLFNVIICPRVGRPKKKKTQVLAYSRRQRENDTFMDIAQALPIQENAKDLDKASILRLAIHYLKLKDLLRDGSEQLEMEGEEGEGEEGTEGEGNVESPTTSLSEETTALLQSEWVIWAFCTSLFVPRSC